MFSLVTHMSGCIYLSHFFLSFFLLLTASCIEPPHLPSCCLSGPKWIKWIRNRSRSRANSIAWILSNPRWIDSQTKELQRCNWDAWSALSNAALPDDTNCTLAWWGSSDSLCTFTDNDDTFGLQLLLSHSLWLNLQSYFFMVLVF